MVNTQEFIERLELLLDYYGLSAAAFADKLEVQRSGISHLLNGRNRPSLDFVMKVVKTFPEVNLYWLLNGKGHFPAARSVSETPSTPIGKQTAADSAAATGSNGPTGKQIERIVVFYTDGSFRSYHGE